MSQPNASLPLKILYAAVAAMLLWAIIGSVMGAGLAEHANPAEASTLPDV